MATTNTLPMIDEGVMEMTMRAQFFEGWRLDGTYCDGGRIPFDDFVSPALSVIFESKEDRFVALLNSWWL